MKKIALLTMPLIVLAAIRVILFTINNIRLPTWRTELNRYIQFTNESMNGKFEIHVAMKARKPWNFVADMSHVMVGESVYYQTNIQYHDELPDQELGTYMPGEPTGGGLLPLPYPIGGSVVCISPKNERLRKG